MIKTAKELAAACEAVAKNYKSLYVLGCIGAPMNQSRLLIRHTQSKPKVSAEDARIFSFLAAFWLYARLLVYRFLLLWFMGAPIQPRTYKDL